MYWVYTRDDTLLLRNLFKQLPQLLVISLGLIEIYVFFIKGPNIIFKKIKRRTAIGGF
jgi:uncharacterized membrane protein YobD (UPF0266 family)